MILRFISPLISLYGICFNIGGRATVTVFRRAAAVAITNNGGTATVYIFLLFLFLGFGELLIPYFSIHELNEFIHLLKMLRNIYTFYQCSYQ